MWGWVCEISRMNKYVIIDSKFTEALNPSHSKERARDLTPQSKWSGIIV